MKSLPLLLYMRSYPFRIRLAGWTILVGALFFKAVGWLEQNRWVALVLKCAPLAKAERQAPIGCCLDEFLRPPTWVDEILRGLPARLVSYTLLRSGSLLGALQLAASGIEEPDLERRARLVDKRLV